MSDLAMIGHNNPPDPVSDATSPFQDYILEAGNWADGTKVKNEEQMATVDALIRHIKDAEKAVGDARDAATKPLHSAWQDEIAKWKPTLVDLERLKKCLLALVSDFKAKLAAEKAEAKRVADALAWEATRKAQDAARAADVSDIEAQRAAAAAMQEAAVAQRRAMAAGKDTVKGMRKVTLYEVTDHRALLHWIAKNDREAMTAFIDAWAKANHKQHPGADGLRVWESKEAF